MVFFGGGGLWENNIQKAYLPKISIPGHIVFEKLAKFWWLHANLTQLITLGTESNLEGFVWSHQSKTGLVSLKQFAPQC